MRKTFCDKCKIEITKELQSRTKISWSWDEGNSRINEWADLCKECTKEIVLSIGGRMK